MLLLHPKPHANKMVPVYCRWFHLGHNRNAACSLASQGKMSCTNSWSQNTINIKWFEMYMYVLSQLYFSNHATQFVQSWHSVNGMGVVSSTIGGTEIPVLDNSCCFASSDFQWATSSMKCWHVRKVCSISLVHNCKILAFMLIGNLDFVAYWAGP